MLFCSLKEGKELFHAKHWNLSNSHRVGQFIFVPIHSNFVKIKGIKIKAKGIERGERLR